MRHTTSARARSISGRFFRRRGRCAAALATRRGPLGGLRDEMAAVRRAHRRPSMRLPGAVPPGAVTVVEAQEAVCNSPLPIWHALSPGGVSGAVRNVEPRGRRRDRDYFSRSFNALRYACDTLRIKSACVDTSVSSQSEPRFLAVSSSTRAPRPTSFRTLPAR